MQLPVFYLSLFPFAKLLINFRRLVQTVNTSITIPGQQIVQKPNGWRLTGRPNLPLTGILAENQKSHGIYDT
jgi:hypothetical protein